MGQLEDLIARRNTVAANIEKACNTGFDLNEELEKARSGVYADTAENRKMNRVGQKYGSEKKEDEPKGQREKKQEDGSGKTVSEHAAGASDEALKRAAADDKASPEVKAAAKEEMKKRGSEKKEEKKEEKSKEDKESERNKQRFVRDIIKNGSGKSTDDFMDENIEYYKDILDGAKDLFDLSQKFEEKYENDEKDPYGYERYGKIYIKCMKQIPAEKFNNQ